VNELFWLLGAIVVLVVAHVVCHKYRLGPYSPKLWGPIEPVLTWPPPPDARCGEKPTPKERGELPQPQVADRRLADRYPWLTFDEALVYDGALKKLATDRALRLVELAKVTHVEVYCYWRIGRDGTPTVSICDDPMGHPHAHLVRVPIPEDVQKCIDATKNPPLCLVVGKHGEPTGECPKPSNEPETP